MDLRWTSKALSDLIRLHEFLATVNKPAAARAVQSLTAAAASLLANPRIGERLEEFDPRDIRRILVGRYELRYEIEASTIYLLRLWHTREDR
ncbi:type II toxin-antitoxin system RelE/ParE family toxin [Rugamonas sp. DEMB1]|uniref:type II toxin-antitoxin system RelE/ParE family toxin n=1 Tax=Rugamonas sp. DEMB1 TaxID=3039386 RepID=UPI00244A2738|nr:type II toxin-antitoxin system RelE/ParE family toxin [Rugamonas sp. DEMB1]WGG53463.1 type II toxin-antitoxin system RelE/ParE family toxin [Rugamonas sp. DEMB1]